MLKTKTAKTKYMKNKLMIGGALLLLLAAKPAFADDSAGYDHSDLYRASELSLDLFGSASIGRSTIKHWSKDRVRNNARLGAGMGINYFITRNVGIGGDVYSENTSDTFIDSASANLIMRFPLGDGGLAPSIFGGGGRQFENIDAWFAQLGAGLEYRFSPTVGVFVDARWVVPDETKYYGVARAGLRFAF